MSGRASKELAEELAKGARAELELVLNEVTDAVIKAAIEYRTRFAKDDPRPAAAKSTVSKQERDRLLAEIREQTRLAAS